MKKRWLTILLIALLILSLPAAPALADGGPLAVDKASASLGDTVVLTFTQQSTATVSALVFGFTYNRYTLELLSLDALPYCDMVPDVADCNACGMLSFGYTDPTYEAATVIPAGTVLLKASFRIIADEWGDQTIRMTDYQAAGALDAYGTPEDITPALTSAETVVEIPVECHTWGEPAYEWAEDYSTCTAAVVCRDNADHVVRETVDAVLTVTAPATETEPGAGYCTAGFTLSPFAAQTKELTLPKLTDLHILGSVSGNVLSYTLETVPIGAIVAAVRYDGGRMTDVQTASAVRSSGSFVMKGSGTSFKLFLIGKSSFTPLCPAWSLNG